MKLARKLIIIIIPAIIGCYFFNLIFVSGPNAFFDCRITSAADMNGYKMLINPTGGGVPAIGITVYPETTICPIEMPKTMEECQQLYYTYRTFDRDSLVRYDEYQITRCGIELTCEQEFKYAVGAAMRHPNVFVIPYEEYLQKICTNY